MDTVTANIVSEYVCDISQVGANCKPDTLDPELSQANSKATLSSCGSPN